MQKNKGNIWLRKKMNPPIISTIQTTDQHNSCGNVAGVLQKFWACPIHCIFKIVLWVGMWVPVFASLVIGRRPTSAGMGSHVPYIIHIQYIHIHESIKRLIQDECHLLLGAWQVGTTVSEYKLSICLRTWRHNIWALQTEIFLLWFITACDILWNVKVWGGWPEKIWKRLLCFEGVDECARV